MNQAYKSVAKMDICHPSLIHGDDLADRVKPINDTNRVTQTLMASSLTVLGATSTLLRVQKRDIDIAAINPALSGLKDRITSAKKWKTHNQTELSETLV